MMDDLIKLALETINMQKQAMIFLPSRASAEKTAEDIAAAAQGAQSELEQEVLRVVTSPTKQCRRLSHCVKKGIAFHHSGLTGAQKELVEEAFREGKIKIICATPTLCLSGDTEIWQPTGQTAVKDFKNSELFALSQDHQLQVIKAKETNKNINSQNLIEITSVSGYSIKLTPNHKILVKRKRRQLINAAECKNNDKIATVGKLNFCNFTKPKLSDFIQENKCPIKDRELTSDDFYFIGSMLGDGYSGAETRDDKIFYKGSPTFTSGDLASIELIKTIVNSFDLQMREIDAKGSSTLVLTKKKWFREFLCKTGIEIGKNKYIHPKISQADLNLVKHLISGLFDTDGYVQNGRNIGFSNISLELIKNIQRLLLRFGIVVRIRKRPSKMDYIIRKEYRVKDQYELTINQQQSIFLFLTEIGFRLERKQKNLKRLVESFSHVLYSSCNQCNYRIYSDLFTGRTKEQKAWGVKKKKIIALLGERYELGSKEIQKVVGFLPRHPTGNRLNHHYELINKRKIGKISKTEWYWSLNAIGSWIYWKILKQNKDIIHFSRLTKCPLCRNKLDKKLRKNWRSSDVEGDIFWDYVRTVKEVAVEEEVYDVVLPDKPKNDHLFVANGFIVHNSAGVSLPAYRVIIKSLKRFSGGWGMDWIPVLEYLQMAGRAGRPEYEKEGQAIMIAKDEAEKEELYEKYICGVPEEIYSKLAVEPVLRTYLLSLIASGIIRDEQSMRDFFSKTFWAHQFKDVERLQEIMSRMLLLLEGWSFITVEGNTLENKQNSDFISAKELTAAKKENKENKEKILRATTIGKRVSELYLDPLTARHLLDGLAQFKKEKHSSFSLLQMFCHTLEMRPLLQTKKREEDLVQEELNKRFELLLEKEPSVFDSDYGEFMNSIKTALFFEEWTSEKDEDYLLEKFDIRPGEVKVKLDLAEWLLYSSEELAGICQYHDVVTEIRKLRVRVQNGVKEELLPLLKLKGIGRVRARRLYTAGVRDLGDVKNIDGTSLGQILGKAIAEDVKKQVGVDVAMEIPKGTRKGQLSLMKFGG